MATMEQQRAWRGPVAFSHGFRPFFLGGGVMALLLIAAWVPWFLGWAAPRNAFSPLDWHVHELLFGYVPAVIAGFLLTAVPNWTGRLPVVGWPLVVLFGLWVLGRVLVVFSSGLPPLVLGVGTLAFPLALAGVAAREIIAGKNWRNLKVLIVLGLLVSAQVLFQWEALYRGASVYGARLGVATTIVLIMIIGGRIIPSFTLNWIKRENPGAEPVPFGPFDKRAMILGGLALALWVVAPALPAFAPAIGVVLLASGGVQLRRGLRWVPLRTFRAPLVAVLHVAHAFVPLGFGLAGAALLMGHAGLATAAIHAWTAGAIGLMTLAVMTRASRGHSGLALIAPPSTVLVYVAVVAGALLRIVAALVPTYMSVLLPLSGAAWVLGFATFVVVYGPVLLHRRAP